MPLYRLLQNQAFDPELVQTMTFAFETICRERGFQPVTHDSERERLARLVIEYAQRGASDPEKLRELVSDAL